MRVGGAFGEALRQTTTITMVTESCPAKAIGRPGGVVSANLVSPYDRHALFEVVCFGKCGT